MTERSFRLTVLASALAWFLLGLHAPMVHQITQHHRMPDATVLIVMVVLTVAGVVSVVALLRGGRGGAAPHA